LSVISDNYEEKWVDVNKELNQLQKKFNQIVYQKGANGEIIYSIMNKNTNLFVVENNIDIILSQCTKNKYQALIDNGALFSDYSNLKIAEKLSKVYNNVMYFDDKNNLCVYSNNNSKLFNSDNHQIDDNTIVYFDNGHILGVDIRLPSTSRGLVTVSDKSTYSSFAQSIFRLRKLNRGQMIDIIGIKIMFNDQKNKKNMLLNMLIDREINRMKSNYLFHITQCTKLNHLLKNPDKSIYKKEYRIEYNEVKLSHTASREEEREKEKEKEKESIFDQHTFMTYSISAYASFIYNDSDWDAQKYYTKLPYTECNFYISNLYSKTVHLDSCIIILPNIIYNLSSIEVTNFIEYNYELSIFNKSYIILSSTNRIISSNNITNEQKNNIDKLKLLFFLHKDFYFDDELKTLFTLYKDDDIITNNVDLLQNSKLYSTLKNE
jgi:hypothetical protein